MHRKQSYRQPEIWGGIECTIVRIGDSFNDQLEYSGHYSRETDIATLAATGIKKLRYPILWEKHQPLPDQQIDWTWIEGQLNLIKSHGIDPIAGLVHHGSGPEYTSLADSKFPDLLADYAGKVAEKFPWIEFYTPVNEPLTTARFSGLYGIWYPHLKDDHSFLTMLVNQVKATVLSMKAIRQINPNAKLVQTEDLAKTYSTPLLKYQADFENERRWLSLDLLCGKVDQHHPLWRYLMKFNVNKDDLIFLQKNPCPPDILGFNYYLTSERYLDENMIPYRLDTHGGNYKHKYADVEAVRIEVKEPSGIKVLLREAVDRFQLPIAITEAHLHCSREEQLRWFTYIYSACDDLSKEGFQVEAVTAWSMLGSFGWNKLLTCSPGEYEPGTFDVRTGVARPTALAKYIADITDSPLHQRLVNAQPGWWSRDSRYLISSSSPVIPISAAANVQPLLILGKNGTLGKAFSKLCNQRNIANILLSRQNCDITDKSSVEKIIQQYKPWGIINTTGYVKVDEAETDCDNCYASNTIGVEHLAKACETTGVKLVTFSSDLVFDGRKISPYVESDQVNPLNVYGKSKARAEHFVSMQNPSALIIRTSSFFSTWDEYNFAHFTIQLLSNRQQFTVAKDVYISPTYIPDLVNATLDLMIDDESGIWHLINDGITTWAEFAFEIADRAALDTSFINVMTPAEINWAAPRPAYSVLKTEKGYLLPTLENALDRFFACPILHKKLQVAQHVLQRRSILK